MLNACDRLAKHEAVAGALSSEHLKLALAWRQSGRHVEAAVSW